MRSTPIEGIELFESMDNWPYALVLVTIEGGPKLQSFNVLGQNETNDSIIRRLLENLDHVLSDYGWEASLSRRGNSIRLDPTGPAPVDVETYVEILCYD